MILLVGQESQERNAIANILRQAGYEVREAATGQEALRLVQDGPELVFLDVNLPDLNGLEVRRRIKANPQTAAIPVVYLSGSDGTDADRIATLEEGAEACLTQPVHALDLLATVRTCLRLRASEVAVRLRDWSYRALVESASDGIFCTNGDGGFLDANAAGCRMLGYKHEELLALNVRDIFAAEEIARIVPEIARVNAGQVVHSAWLLQRRDGTRFPGEVDATALPDGRLVSIVRDRTEFKNLEESGRARERELLEAQRMAGMGSWEWTPATGKLDWSEGVNHILRGGRRLPSPTFETLAQLYTPESWERLRAAAAKVIQTGLADELELEIIRDDGTRCWVKMFAEARRGPDGSFVAVRGTLQDIDQRKRAELAVRQEKDYNRIVADSLPGLFYVIDEHGRFLRVNQNFEDLSGCTSEEISHMASLDFIKETDKSLVAERIQQVFSEGEAVVEAYFVTKDQTEIPYLFYGKRFTREGSPCLIGLGVDITERKRTERLLIDSESKHRVLFEESADANLLMGEKGFLDCNAAALQMFGYSSKAELLALHPSEFSPLNQPDGTSSRQGSERNMGTAFLHGKNRFEWMHRRKNGETFPAEVCITALTLSGCPAQLGTIRDITERKRTEEQIIRLARYDTLTGLANRAVFVESLDHAIARAGRGEHFAVLYLDLDHFKDVNDTLGHPIGDLLLQAVANRLQASVRKVDLVARFGGDEFAIILTRIGDPLDIARVAERILAAAAIKQCASEAAATADKILKAFDDPFSTQGNEIHSGATIGIAIYGPDSPDAETILSHADVALYRAKSEGRGHYYFFTEAMDIEVRERVQLSTELREAIVRDQLFLVYQPQVDIETGRVVGLEALVRWHHPTRGTLGPGKFIPLAETNGLIVPLGRWVMRTVCHQIRQWLNAGITVPVTAINLSGGQFKSTSRLESDIAASLKEFGVPARLLELELTESVLMTASGENNDLLVRLRETGHRIAIDDFGSGYSSLDYLRRYPADRIKIAQSFTADLGIVPGSDAIVKAAIALAHELALKVVVEGVETEAQLVLLKGWGCRIVQGYYFSRPLQVAEMAAMLRLGKITPANTDIIETPALAVS